MKTLLVIVALLFSTSAFGQEPTIKSEVKHFYITYSYVNCAGEGKIGVIGYKVKSGYPKDADVVTRIWEITKDKGSNIHIIGRNAMCRSDYENFFK